MLGCGPCLEFQNQRKLRKMMMMMMIIIMIITTTTITTTTTFVCSHVWMPHIKSDRYCKYDMKSRVRRRKHAMKAYWGSGGIAPRIL
jgi:hypothetical protein